MSSISSIPGQNARLSPLDLLQNELSSEVSAGTISSSDQTALSAALKDIGSTLKSQGAADPAAGTAPPSPADMKAKIDSLIDGEVANGKLTTAQASELKNVFANAFAKGGPGGAGGPSPADATGQSGSSTDVSTDTGTTGSSSTDMQQALNDFLKLLQNSTSTLSGYDASGQSTSVSSALLLDWQG